MSATMEAVAARPSWVLQAVRRALPAAVVFVVGLMLWELAVIVFDIKQILLPRPSVIANRFVANLGTLWSAGLLTFRNAVGGFAIGAMLGILAALAASRWAGLREGLMPFAIAANSTPIIALAPITNQWFGITNPMSKMSVVAVIVFFPVMINMVRGLRGVDAAHLELMRSYAATPREAMTIVRLPNSLPYLFSAFKVASALSVIAAIVVEYFGGTQDALGQYIIQQASLTRFPEAWAAIVVASAMGILFYGAVALAERIVMPWHHSLRDD